MQRKLCSGLCESGAYQPDGSKKDQGDRSQQQEADKRYRLMLMLRHERPKWLYRWMHSIIN